MHVTGTKVANKREGVVETIQGLDYQQGLWGNAVRKINQRCEEKEKELAAAIRINLQKEMGKKLV